MVLIEADPVLPAAVEAIRARVLIYLQATQPMREFLTVPELCEFLDQEVLDPMAARGYPRALTQVTLIYKTPAALDQVSLRMADGAALMVFHAPGCWRYFAPRLEEMRQCAERLEPDFTRTSLARLP